MKKITLLWLFAPVALLIALTYTFSGSPKVTAKYEHRVDQLKNIGAWKGAQNLYYMLRRNSITGEVSTRDILNAREAVQARDFSFAKTTEAFSWEDVGPDNVGGRTRAILVDNTTSDGSRVYAGGVSGGVFVSDNFGNNWRALNNSQENLCISSMAQGSDGTIWVATGSDFDNANQGGVGNSGFIGGGLFKFTPGSTSLTKISSASPAVNDENAEWSTISVVRVDQTSGRIYAGQNEGLRISDDGGNSWINPVKNGAGNPITSSCQDIELASDGTVLTVLGGQLFRSPSGNNDTYTYIGTANGFVGSATRIETSISPANNDIVFAVMCNNTWNFSGLYKSTNRGLNWSKIPMLNTFNPFKIQEDETQGQAFYDMVCAADPIDANTVYIGGIELYKYNGNITHISQWNAPPFSPNYVHADQHTFAYNPKNKNELYFGNDGGVFKTYNQGNFFYAANRGYNVTQFYSVAYSPEGYMLGGTQDNGTIQVHGFTPIYPQEGQEISGGDGFDCEISQISPVIFATVYNGEVRKFKVGGGGGNYENFADANFYTCISLWESHQDATSQDTITYVIEDGTTKNVLRKGDGVIKKFEGTIVKSQTDLKFVSGSIRFKAGTQEATDTDGDGVLGGNATGTFNYSTGEYSVTFTSAPPNLTDVSFYFQGSIDAGGSLTLRSNTPEVRLRGNPFTVNYTAFNNLVAGDTVRVQDPVQSLLAFGASTGRIYLTRNALRDVDADWFYITYGGGQGVQTMKFSENGNHLFVGTTSGNIYRISGLNNVYDSLTAQTVANGGEVTITRIFAASGRVVTGISVSPRDPNKVAISLGGYGETNHIYLSSQALVATTTSGSGTFASIQGDLPAMPVYDILLCDDATENILVGTEFGVYSSSVFTTSTWTEANGNMPRVPVFGVRQQTASWDVSTNSNEIYLGTHGRGFWRTNSLVGISKPQEIDYALASGLTVYPNPAYAKDFVNLQVYSQKESLAQVQVFDLSGKQVYAQKESLQKGNNNISININRLSAGTYFVSLQSGQELKTSKFVVQK